MKFSLYILLFFVSSIFSQENTIKPIPYKGNQFGVTLSNYYNNYNSALMYRFSEQSIGWFYNRNRFTVSIGFITMRNNYKAYYNSSHLFGPSANISVDVISHKKIKIPFSMYCNYYQLKFDVIDENVFTQLTNKGCKLGLEYMPFKFGLTAYFNLGFNYFEAKQKVKYYPNEVRISHNKKLMPMLEFGIKYYIKKNN